MTKSWIGNYVDTADFTGLFVEELGWNRPSRNPRTVTITVDGTAYTLTEAASYRGVVIWACSIVPPRPAQRAIDRQLKGESAERVVIFHDDHRQVWRWPQARDPAGAGTPRLVAHEHAVGRPNEALRQRLNFIKIDIDGPEVTVIELVRRLRRAFDSERITKSFYSKFAQQHRDLTAAIEGLPISDGVANPELRLYGSILLNRLMFIYFMQRKGFLDGDFDYLRTRLQEVQKLQRPGSFYEFYRDFLIPLFHEGLGATAESRAIPDPAIRSLIGDIPYINGGIFSIHPLEATNAIRVPDEAFAQVFDFFDQWQWHLDDRPSGNPNEINPDVLGYIFEQFVNNREEVAKGNTDAATNSDKGAFYTKEDVTGYITSSTLIPVFLDRLVERTGINPWRLISSDPSRYIWPSLTFGGSEALPRHIEEESARWPRPRWDEPIVQEGLGLPGESWWEVVERREHAGRLAAMAKDGAIRNSSQAVAANLDMEVLAVDVVDALDNPKDVQAAWEALSSIRVIDPTCGSGAFLFAALNILNVLYQAIFEAACRHAITTNDNELLQLVEMGNRHPNTDYFLLKHATLRNIYGVDIMPEAVEIARLRLFLKLIAQIEDRTEVEPLPDLEFNIRSGNVLVGALDADEIRARVDLFSQEEVEGIQSVANEVAVAYRAFAEAQEAGNYGELAWRRTQLRALAATARDKLDAWWHASDDPSSSINSYLYRYQPFHWLIEFPEVFEQGGFDVVVGNPPYVQKKKILYSYAGFETDDCPDIYAPCTERASQICSVDGRLGMIVMLSLSFSDDFKALRRHLREQFPHILASSFSRRPSTLFTGAGVRSTIVVCARGESMTPTSGLGRVFTTDTRRWVDEFRPNLMETLRYTEITGLLQQPGDQWLRTGDGEIRDLLVALREFGGALEGITTRTGSQLGFKQTALYFLSVYVDEPPAYDAELRPIAQPKVGRLAFRTEEMMLIASAILAGRFAFAWWGFKGDDFDVTSGVLKSLPVDVERVPQEALEQILVLARRLRVELPHTQMYTLYAKKWLGNYDMKLVRHITDQIDECLLAALNLERFLPAVHRAEARLSRSSGDAGNTIRSWPPGAS